MSAADGSSPRSVGQTPATLLVRPDRLPGSKASGLPLALISLSLGSAVLVSIWCTDESTVVTPAGIGQKQI